MAGNITDFLELKLLDHSLGTTSYTKPTNVYLALFTSATSDAAGGTEVSTAGGSLYARQAVTFSAAASGSATHAADIAFPVAGASWGTITHIALFDAATGGNMLWHGPLNASKAIGSGDQFRMPAGQLTVSLD
jgi:hypothetical protein